MTQIVQVTGDQIKTMSPDDIAKMINTLASAAAAKSKLSFKVGAKGGLSVFGLNSRFPVTLYIQQWERLFAVKDELFAFAKANDKVLTRK
jgi:hypothetical protein